MATIEQRPTDFLPLTPAVLHILLALADGEQHGYAIAQAVEELTSGTVRMGPGTLYGSIGRMVASGLIEESARTRNMKKRERSAAAATRIIKAATTR